ncbi:MAG TPA: mannose-1-phosphate guanylyltransferase [bacterium]|nr:mannose-1-phosphate guanylyltransferase [bacterium]HPS30385.1 mannose-1-phosphate guanylyltransferase [bacterium]
MKLVTIIMAGGSGKRFWPLSRESKAKQSLSLFSEKTLLAETIERILPLCDDITVVSSIKQKKAIDPDIRSYSQAEVIYEPSGRNTAPCIMLALHSIKSRLGEDCAVLVLPADHFIQDSESFRKTVARGLKYLSEHKESVGTIGIEPAYPEIGFGYIQKNKTVKEGVFSVKSFEEKPVLEKAKMFVESGNYLWNAGIFLFSLDTMLNEFKTMNLDIYETVVKINSFKTIDPVLYNSVRSISFDYAIMEKTKRPVFTVPGDFGWSDVGNWLAYYELLEKDESGNAAKGKACFVDCVNSLVVNQTGKTVFLFNRNCELIIAIDDVILSASLNDHQELRKISEYLERTGKTNFL